MSAIAVVVYIVTLTSDLFVAAHWENAAGFAALDALQAANVFAACGGDFILEVE